MNTIIFLSIILFLVGLYFYAKTSYPKHSEGLTNSSGNTQARCPNMLVQKGSSFYLYNSNLAEVPGVNPIEFANLEDYVEFLDWQRSQGIRCPVLYLQESYDAQGNSSYKVRPSVTEQQGGLPPNPPVYPSATLSTNTNITATNNPQNNINSYPAYNQPTQLIDTPAPVNMPNVSPDGQLISPDAMDANWGGAQYTQSLINKGYYSGNNVAIYVE